ncbi:MAG: hypothetical protein H0X30_09980 [Anaerolineae bacterium]|nr:hypothetical protein [Anaerolineae bacterium]
MQRRNWVLVFLVISLFSVLPAAAQTATPVPMQFTQQTDPASLIGSYYNAITLADYPRAYSYWESAPGNQTETQFAAGFADTASAQVLVQEPIFEDAGAGNVHASVPTLVIANRKNGTQAYYAGCFITHKTNVPVGNATEPDPNWHLQSATLKQQNSLSLAALATACTQPVSLMDGLVPPNQLDPLQTVTSYFTALATGGVITSYWEDPNQDIVYQTYGKELTHEISLELYVNPVIDEEGAAGSAYATVPALVVLNTPDNTKQYLTGCYVTRLSNVPVGNATEPDPNWHFYNATIGTLGTDVAAAIATVAQGCTP